MRRFAPVFTSLLLLAAPAFGQNFGPLPPLTEQLEVNVVNVDVTVTDRNGKPVMDLTKDDFEVFEDGKSQPITNFAVLEKMVVKRTGTTAAAPSGAAAPDAATEGSRKILLLIDNNYLETQERNLALRKIEKYLDESFGGEWAVGMIGHTVTMVQPFTTDRQALRAAFERVRNSPTHYVQQAMDRAILSDRSRREMEAGNEYDYAGTIRFAAREQTYRALMTMQNTARAVVETTRAYAADGGKKFIILVGGGMEQNTTFTSWSGKVPDREMEQMKLDMSRLLDGMVREANAANFTVHVINARARGMMAPQHGVENKSSGMRMDGGSLYRGQWGNDPIDTTDVDSAPLSIAGGTGGMYLPGSDIVQSVARIDEQTSNFYSLGYSPAHTGDRQYHQIKVRVKREGVRVANRVGYYDLSRADRLEGMLRARMTFDRPLGSLPVEVSFGKPRTRDTDLVVPVQAALPIDKVTMLPHDDAFVGRVHVYLSVFDASGNNVAFHHQVQEVLVSAAQLNDAATAFHYTMNVRMGKGGPFKVVMTLRDELSNEIGSATKSINL